MVQAFAGGLGRKLLLLAIGVCLALPSGPAQAMPIRVAPVDQGAQPVVEQVRASSRPRRAQRRSGGGGAGAALALGAVALGVGAIIASQQRSREERRARRYYEEQYYPARQYYYEPRYVQQPAYEPNPVYREPAYERYVEPQPVYRAPRRVYQPAPASYYEQPRARPVQWRAHRGQTARRERHEAMRQYWNR